MDAAPELGPAAGLTVLWALANTSDGRQILAAHPELLTKGSLDAAPKDGSGAGPTVLWTLASTPTGRQILEAHPELLYQGNLNAAPEYGRFVGLTVLWVLANTTKGLEILAAHPQFLHQGNLNTASECGEFVGLTVLWILANTTKGLEILAAHPEFLHQGNLNVAPEYGEFVGLTVLWILANTTQGLEILAAYPEFLHQGNLDATPEHGPAAGQTVLWVLANTPDGRQILAAHPELLTKGNLNATPKQGSYAGKTVYDCLKNTSEGIPLLTHLEMLKYVNPHRLTAPKTNAPHPENEHALSQKRKRSGDSCANNYDENKDQKKEAQGQGAISPPLKRLKSIFPENFSSPDGEKELPLSRKRKYSGDKHAHNNEDKKQQQEPSFKRFRGGIAPKYMGGAAPAKMPLKPRSKAELPKMQELSFIPVHSIRTSSSSLYTHRLEPGALDGYILSRKKEFTPGQISTFICAGRKANALIPHLTQGQCALICTEEELEQVLPYLSDSMDILVITTLNSRYNGNYADHLDSITARRLAAFLFAFKYSVDRFILLDDNIQKVLVNTKNQTAVSWHELYNALSAQLGDKASISVATRDGRRKASNELGSKLFLINMARIRSFLAEEEHLFFLFPDATQTKKWGEDYYFQIFLDYLFQQDKQAGYGIVPLEHMSLLRSKKHRNAFKSSGINATAFAMTESLEPLPSALRPLVYQTICSLNDLIITNQENYERYEQFQRHFNLRQYHAAVNNNRSIPVNAPSPFLKGTEFKTNFYNLINHYDYNQSILRSYQIEAIKAIPIRYHFPSRYLLATGSGKTLIENTLALMAYHAVIENQLIFIVTPQIELVNQLYGDLINYNNSLRDRQDPLCISNDAILKVSSHGQSISLKLFRKNESVKNASSIVICCADSFQNLLAEDPAQVESAALVLFDEYHVYTSLIQKVCDTISEEGPITIASSATPPKHDCIPNTLYTLSLKEALNGPYHAPIVACSLNVDYSKKNAKNFLRCLPEFLKRQYHPGIGEKGRTLAETKGVIYVQSIKLCDQVYNLLEKAKIKAYAIHSQNHESDAEVKRFVASREPGVLIAVRKLRFGFDCRDLTWEIIARKPSTQQPQHDVEQMVGRIVRLYEDTLGFVISFRDIHHQYVLPLTQNQTKNIRLSSDFLAHEMEYFLNNRDCRAIDIDKQSIDKNEIGLASPTIKLLPYTPPNPLEQEIPGVPHIESNFYEKEKEKEKEKEEDGVAHYIAPKTVSPSQAMSLFAPSPQIYDPKKPSSTEYLYELIACQNEKELVAFLTPALKIITAASSTAVSSFFTPERALSPNALMINDFFTQIPTLELTQLIQCAEGKYFAHLLRTCSENERDKLILSGVLDSLWMNLDLNELLGLTEELKIYRSSYALAHLVNILFIRHHDRSHEENEDIIPELQSLFLNESIFYMKSNPHHKVCTEEAIGYLESLLDKVNLRLNLTEDTGPSSGRYRFN